MYTTIENHPLHPANQDTVEMEHDSRDELFGDMCQYLDESRSNIYLLGLDNNGWYFTKEDGDKESKHRLPTKFWLVAR